MRMQKTYFRLTLVISLFFGIILPLIVGVKDPTLLALFFSSIWFIYAVAMFLKVFLIQPRLKIKVIRDKNPTIVRFELKDPERKKNRIQK
jgi:hypothetical protein